MYGESSSICSIFYVDVGIRFGIPHRMSRALVPDLNPGGIPDSEMPKTVIHCNHIEV